MYKTIVAICLVLTLLAVWGELYFLWRYFVEVNNPLRRELEAGAVIFIVYGSFPAFLGMSMAYFRRSQMNRYLKLSAYFLPVVLFIPYIIYAVF